MPVARSKLKCSSNSTCNMGIFRHYARCYVERNIVSQRLATRRIIKLAKHEVLFEQVRFLLFFILQGKEEKRVD